MSACQASVWWIRYTRELHLHSQGAEQLEPEAVLQLSTAQLRECGLSGQKAGYIQDIAQRFASGQLTTARIVGGHPYHGECG